MKLLSPKNRVQTKTDPLTVAADEYNQLWSFLSWYVVCDTCLKMYRKVRILVEEIKSIW